MDLSVSTDYVQDTGCPEPWLRKISEAGFTHIHWCHHWNTDFVYEDAEIGQIETWLSDFGLRLLGLHASAGREKCWGSPREHERLAGVKLVANRIAMTRRLGGDAIVLHAPARHALESQLVSLKELAPVSREHGVRIALENLGAVDLERTDGLVAEHDPEYVGVCYDSGHANRVPNETGFLDSHADRVIAVHLHDNDGKEDEHRIPGDGTVPWDQVCSRLAKSSYAACPSLEVSLKTYPTTDTKVFLEAARAAGQRIADGMTQAASPV